MLQPDALLSQAGINVLHRRPRHVEWALLVLGLLVVFVYWPGLGGGFVFDDFPNIVNNTALHVTWQSGWAQWLAAIFSSPASEMQRPLAMLTFAVNHALTGLDAYWMKLTNLGIHLFNTGLVFALSRRLFQAAAGRASSYSTTPPDWVALWVAAAWALNPINLMGVLFVVQRMESLSHTFVFAGLWLYLLGRMRLMATGKGWLSLFGALVGGTAGGVLAKESAVLLPLYALALEWALLGFASKRQARDGRLLALFSLVLVLPGVLGLAWLLPKVLHANAYAGRNFSLAERLLTEARVLVDYFHWTLLPSLSQLSLYHDDYPISHGLLAPPATLLSVMLLAALASAALWLRKRRPLLALGLAWFLAAHLLTATVWPLELMFEHRNYFASLGLCLVLADLLLLGAPRSQTRQSPGIAVALSLLALYTGLTALRAHEWNDQLRFSLTEAAKHPQSPRATFDVARNFVILSGYQQDSPYLQRASDALDHAMRVPGATTLPESTAILLAARTGQPIRPAWWASLQRKLRTRALGPQETGSLGALVNCEVQRQCQLPPQEMVDTFIAALARGPNAEVLSIYGNYALNVLQDPTLALLMWQHAAELAPKVVQYQVTVARMLIASGRFNEAATHIDKIRQLGRLGQNEAIAEELELLATRESREPETLPRGKSTPTPRPE